jgi:Spy/CpxP family protein refolding chaperone
MNTKATILLGALLSAGTLLAQAPAANQTPSVNATQSAPAQMENHQRTFDPAKQAAHLGKKLGLSSDQVSQITPILADRQQQMQNLRADTSLSKSDRRAKAKSIMEGSKSKIEAVLNDTQKQQFEQMLADRRAHRNHGQA